MTMEVSRRSFLATSAVALTSASLPALETLADEAQGIDLKELLANLPHGSFKSRAGTKVELNRTEGIEKLYKLSETEKSEVSAIYIPSEKVWITTSLEGKENQITSDISYAETFLREGVAVEMFHTHIEPDLSNVAKEHQLFWIVPSVSDTNQILHFGARFGEKVSASIVCKYGTIGYGLDDYSGMDPAKASVYFQKAIRDGASHMQMTVRGIDSSQLKEKLAAFRGVLKLAFTARAAKE